MAAAAGLGVLGGIAGGLSSGSLGKMSELGNYAGGQSLSSLQAYSNLVGQGPGAADYTRGIQSQKDLASQYANVGSSVNGMYNFGAGNQLASQAFAGQREALNQNFSSQLQQASRSASLAGRSSNDPILRARLAQQQTMQQSQLDANQASAGVNFARQSVTDQLSNATQNTNLLSGLGNQALTNQQSLFTMSQGAQQNERNWLLSQAQNERAAGGGLKGAITGALGGAASGMQLAQGFGAMSGGGGASALSAVGSGAAQGAASYFNGPNPYASGGQGLVLPNAGPSAAPSFAPRPQQAYSFGGNPNNFAQYQQPGQINGFGF